MLKHISCKIFIIKSTSHFLNFKILSLVFVKLIALIIYFTELSSVNSFCHSLHEHVVWANCVDQKTHQQSDSSSEIFILRMPAIVTLNPLASIETIHSYVIKQFIKYIKTYFHGQIH